MKKRIVILSAFLSPFRSGAEACAEEVPLLLSDRYDFVIITARGKRSLLKHDLLQGKISVIRVGLGLGLGLDKWLYPFLAAWEVRKHKPEIVHAILETFAGLALLFCKRTYPKAKRILTCQTTNTSFLKKTIIQSPDLVTVISAVLKKEALRYRESKDIVHIVNGVNASMFPKRDKVSGRLLFVGRLEPMKGVDILLHSFARIAPKYPSTHLRIVGAGSQRSNLERLSRKLGLSDRVMFMGFIPVPDIYEEFACAEIFCGFSRSEALGNVFLEALAAECAVIGTDVGGIPENIGHESTGLLIPPDDVDAATAAIEKYLNNPSLRIQYTTAAKPIIRRDSWDSTAKKYQEQYERLLA